MAFAVSTIVAGIGVGVAGVGLYENYTNSQSAAASNAAAAQQQAQIAQIQAANVDVQRQQLDLTSNQQLLQNQTQRTVIQDQAQADAIRQQAATLDATRRQRDAVRSGIVARAQGLATATNEGANEVGSTGVRQAYASTAGQTNTNIAGITKNLDLTTKLYGINKQISQTYLDASFKNDEFVAQSKVLQNQVLDNQKSIYEHGGTASLDYASAAISSGNAATGQGLTSLGTALVSNSNKTGNLTNFFTSNNETQQASDFTPATGVSEYS